MIDGVRINGKHSYTDYGLFLARRPDYGTPTPKTAAIEIPGADGELDCTEYTGEVRYNDRDVVVEFSAKIPIEQQAELISLLNNEIHGQQVELIFDDDPDWRYVGRAELSFSEVYSWKMRITMTVRCQPYKLAVTSCTATFHMLPDQAESIYVDMKPAVIDEYAGRSMFVYNEDSGDFSFSDGIRINYKAVYSPLYSLEFNIYDASGTVIAFGALNGSQLSPLADVGYMDFDTTSIDVSNVRRIEVVGSAKITSVQVLANLVPISLYNDRKTVVPTIFLYGATEISVFANGRRQVITSGGRQYENLVLTANKNEIAVQCDTPQSLSFSWVKGRL